MGLPEISGVFILGATNYPQNIDPAAMRPGRFDLKILVGMPSNEVRQHFFVLLTSQESKGWLKAEANIDSIVVTWLTSQESKGWLKAEA